MRTSQMYMVMNSILKKDDELEDETVTDNERSIITPKVPKPALPKMLPFQTSVDSNERITRGKEISIAPEGREFVIPQAPTIVGGSSSNIFIDYVNNNKKKEVVERTKRIIRL